MATIKDRARFVVDARHLEGLMDLLSQVIICEMLWPIVTHLNRLVRVGISHFEITLFVVLLSKLLKLKITCLLEGLMVQLALGNLSGLADEVIKSHVEIIETVQVHLSLVELILEVQ